jgi:RNA polymerase sigma-70 factor (ECF subfamily)
MTDVAKYFAVQQPKLRAFIRSIVFNPSDVDDILQDVAVTAIQNSERYDATRPVNAWVMGIARNRVLKYLEKRRTQSICFSPELVEALVSSTACDESSENALESLQNCLSKLDAEKRSLIVRRHQPGVTSRALAQEIGYTDSRMSRLLNSVYAALMRCVEKELAS